LRSFIDLLRHVALQQHHHSCMTQHLRQRCS
jgi:hypothetical protein